MTGPEAAAVREWIAGRANQLVDELSDWVRIPSVAGVPAHEIDRVRSANWLAAALRDTGFPTVEIWPGAGSPAVWAEWRVAPGAPTVLVYSHHDVRAVKADLWEQCAPFEPVLREGRLYGRGTSDAKGQVLAHLWGLRAYLAAGHAAPPVNLTVLVEGEEEIGSPHLAELLDEHGDRIKADLVLLSDTMTWAADVPAVCTGVRGRMQAEVAIVGPHHDLHAGAASGPTPNPGTVLAELVTQLHDADGRITIPGFYDDVAEPSPAERAELTRLTSDEPEWVARVGSRAAVTEPGCSLGEQLYLRPSIEVATLISGDPDAPPRGVIPSTSRAELLFSLVPDQRPGMIGERFRAWVADAVPDYVEHSVEIDEKLNQPPYATPQDHPAVHVLAGAMSDAWGRPAARMRNAGAAPVTLLTDRTGAPVLFFGTGLPEDRWHSTDESVHLGVLRNGAVTMTLFWPRLAERLSSVR